MARALSLELPLQVTPAQAAALAQARAAALVAYRDSAAPDAEPVRKALEDAAQVLGRLLGGLPPVATVPVNLRTAGASMRAALIDLAGVALPELVAKAIGAAYAGIAQLEAIRKELAERTFAGMPVIIEQPVGSTKSGVGPDGNAWTRTYSAPYGYVGTGQDGGDGESLDVYLGPDEAAPNAYWIHQTKTDGTFDEFKLILGAKDETEAKAIYTAHTPAVLMGKVTKMSMPVLLAMLGVDGKTGQITRSRAPLYVSKALRAEDAAKVAVHKVMPFTDGAGESHYVLGVVLEPQDPNNVTDLGGDAYNAEEIEGAQQLWTEQFGNFDQQHGMLANHKIQVLENYIVRCDGTGITIAGRFVPRGSWVLGARITDDALWADVRAGLYTGWSINGLARRKPIAA